MGDQEKIGALKKQLRELEAKRDALINERAHETGFSIADSCWRWKTFATPRQSLD
jgi:hypothetical protein